MAFFTRCQLVYIGPPPQNYIYCLANDVGFVLEALPGATVPYSIGAVRDNTIMFDQNRAPNTESASPTSFVQNEHAPDVTSQPDIVPCQANQLPEALEHNISNANPS